MFDELQRKLEDYDQRIADISGALLHRRQTITAAAAKQRNKLRKAEDGPTSEMISASSASGRLKDYHQRRRMSLPPVIRPTPTPSPQQPSPDNVNNHTPAATAASRRRRGSVFVRLPSQSQSNSTRPASDDDTDADTADAAAAAANADAALISEMHACRDQLSQLLAAVLQLQTSVASQTAMLKQSLLSAAERRKHIEQQLLDLMQGYKVQMTSIRQTLSTLQVKMQYRLDESTRNVHDTLASCQTKIAKMDPHHHHQQQHQQQSLTVGGGSYSKRLVVIKYVNVTFGTLIAFFFILVSIASLFVSHLTSTRCRHVLAFMILLLVAVIVLACYTLRHH